jgi:hypothetical protein
MNYESLWANIHKKRERIKRGSGEKMRKKGEKGAPTPNQLKRAKGEANEEMTSTSSVAGAGDNPEKIVPVHMKKRKKDRESVIRRFIENRTKSENLMRERILAKYEASRIPRKKGQPAGSDKHSDLYTDENPKGTIHGLGFKDVETAKASVNKIESSSRTHAHKIQAAIAMEQRARVMGKTAEANVYRAYIEKMKKITKQKKNK